MDFTKYMQDTCRLVWRILILTVVFLLPVNTATAYVINIHGSDSAIGTLATADSIISSPGSLTATADFSVIDFDDLGDGSQGNFTINNPFPSGASDTFVAHVTGFFNVAAAGTYTYGINHDDGARLIINGSVWSSFDGVTDNRNSEATGFLNAGTHSVDIVFFENSGGASLEFYMGSAGSRSLVNEASIFEVPEPTILTLLVIGFSGFMLGIRRRSY